MEELGLVGDLAIVAAAAVVGGVLARLLRLPTVLGYLAAGVAIGPHTPGPSGDINDVRTVADLGVALLMFTLGIRFSIRELNTYRSLAFACGIGVTVATLGCGTLVGLALGLTIEQSLVAGMAVSISSTMIALRLLEDRGLIGAPAGRIALVTSLVQDIGVVVMLVMIPVLGEGSSNVAEELGVAVLKGAGLLIGLWLVGTFVLPRVLSRVAASRSRELFLLTVVALALGTASLSFEAGLSLAFGAFLAGLLISESEYAHRTLVEVLPLREVFAVVFFVAIGMLINPDSFVDDPQIVFGFAGVAVAVKIALITVAGTAFGFPGRVVVPAAVALGNMGEFSFVIFSQALDERVLTPELNEALLGAVLVSLAASPLIFAAHEPVLAYAQRYPAFSRVLQPQREANIEEPTRLVNHAVIVGYTQAGIELANALRLRDFRYVVIDESPMVYRDLERQGIPVILGDASLPAVLEQAAVDRARVLAITVDDPLQVLSIVATARDLNKRLDVIARGGADETLEVLQESGVSRVVEAEFEVGMQFVRHTLQRFGMTSQEVQALLARIRRDRRGEPRTR